jgi:hypothetical protein
MTCFFCNARVTEFEAHGPDCEREKALYVAMMMGRSCPVCSGARQIAIGQNERGQIFERCEECN